MLSFQPAVRLFRIDGRVKIQFPHCPASVVTASDAKNASFLEIHDALNLNLTLPSLELFKTKAKNHRMNRDDSFGQP
jgi:hypothetical protein